jgi:hypothetical protein
MSQSGRTIPPVDVFARPVGADASSNPWTTTHTGNPRSNPGTAAGPASGSTSRQHAASGAGGGGRMIQTRKSVGVGVLLTILFNGIGALYVSPGFGVFWMLTNVIPSLLTGGMSLWITWPITVWATYNRIKRDNQLLHWV